MRSTVPAQTHRRAVKTHLPRWPANIQDTRYIRVARDGRDACRLLQSDLGLRPETIDRQSRLMVKYRQAVWQFLQTQPNFSVLAYPSHLPGQTTGYSICHFLIFTTPIGPSMKAPTYCWFTTTSHDLSRDVNVASWCRMKKMADLRLNHAAHSRP
jgi:hypothetical protein